MEDKKLRNRYEAGKQLAHLIQQDFDASNFILLSLPRGGVPVGYEIAKILKINLDVFIVRKIGLPNYPEYGVGAISMDGSVQLDNQKCEALHINRNELDEVIQAEKKELNRRNLLYRGQKPFPQLNNQNVMIVDDGMATGQTMKTVIETIKKHHPKKIWAVIPVASQDAIDLIYPLVDKIIYLFAPKQFDAVGQWYEDFSQVADDEVLECLGRVS